MNPDTGSTFTLRRLIWTRMGVLAFLALPLLVGVFVFLGIQPLVKENAHKQFQLVQNRVTAGVNIFLHPAFRILDNSRGWLKGQAPSLDDPDAFNTLYQPLLEGLPQVSSVVAGTSTGQGWLLLRMPEGAWRNRMTDLSRWPNRHQVIDHFPDNSQVTQWLERGYDPRTRPWYAAAIHGASTLGTFWTEPYTFLTTGELGITASATMRLKDGRDFVLGLDFKLADLSRYTETTKVTSKGLALIVTDEKRVLALPQRPPETSSAQWQQHLFKPVDELGIPAITDAFAIWDVQHRPAESVWAFNSGGQRWMASIEPYRLSNQRLWIAVLAPAADFSPAWTPILMALGGAMVALLTLIIWTVRRDTRTLTRPLEQLLSNSQAIADLNFSNQIPVRSRVREISQLASAQERMGTILQDNQNIMLQQASALHTQLQEQQQTQVQLRQQNSLLSAIIEHFPGGISMVDAQLRVVMFNEKYKLLLDLPDALMQKPELALVDIVRHIVQRGNYGPGDPEQMVSARIAHARQFLPRHIERRLASGTMLEIRDVPLPAGGFVSSFIDITQRKRAEEKLQLAASVFTHAREGIVITDIDGSIIDVNRAFSHITGYSRDEVLGHNPRLLASGSHPNEFYAAIWGDLTHKGHWTGEIWNRRKNGEIYPEALTISAVRNAQGKVEHYLALFSDISALKAHQQQLERVAHYDALTALPNRVLLADRMRQAMAQTQRRGQLLAVAYLDLDGFKAINDTHGHEAGDALLVTLASRMKLALRESDTLARLGGDEFVAVLIDLPDTAASAPLLTRLLEAAALPIEVGPLSLQVSASVGVTFFPQTGDVDADLLLRQADQAMYQAKLSGKNRYHVFDTAQDSSVRGHHESVERIRRAFQAREFVLHYQPKVNMRTGAVIGAEALIRWQHPDKGLLAPAVFLPVIEDHPLAVDIGEWVIASALKQIKVWQYAGFDIPVSVNISARQLQQDDFVPRLRELLAAHTDLAPDRLELEILETSALQDIAQTSRVIEACRDMGVGCALDDFGTGYSSLTYLKRLPVKQLKIDQSFVRDMLDDPDDLAILEGVVGLAGAFGREVIAEGVETVEHGTALMQLGCELAQGYGIARPMPANRLPEWLASWRPDPVWSNLWTVSRDDLPLLFASVEHRAWMAGIAAYLRGETTLLPPTDLHLCRFGQWMDGKGLIRYGEQPIYQTLGPLHEHIHALAGELLTLHNSGDSTQALERLPELIALRDALLAQLATLLRTQPN